MKMTIKIIDVSISGDFLHCLGVKRKVQDL